MTPLVTFGVVGTPIPQGSMKAFVRGGKPRVVAGNQGSLERWRGDVRSGCRANMPDPDGELGLVEGPVGMRLDFRLARPKSHYHPANSRRLAQELRAVALIALLFGLIGLGLLVSTLGAIAAFWIGIAGGWILREIDRYLATHGG